MSRMKIIFILISLLTLTALTFAEVIMSGDAGKKFSNTKAVEKCREANVKAVFICNGNVVKVVSALAGEGSTFYKPDGRIVKCPLLSPTQMGAECIQLLTPNYCPQQTQCGTIPSEIFPGQINRTSEQPTQTVENKTKGLTDVTSRSELPSSLSNEKKIKNEITTDGLKAEEIVAGSPSRKNYDANLDNLILLVAGLGLVSIIILFALFKSTLKED